jgi:hypothetical protein
MISAHRRYYTVDNEISMNLTFYKITKAQASEILSSLLEVTSQTDLGEVNIHYGPPLEIEDVED